MPVELKLKSFQINTKIENWQSNQNYLRIKRNWSQPTVDLKIK